MGEPPKKPGPARRASGALPVATRHPRVYAIAKSNSAVHIEHAIKSALRIFEMHPVNRSERMQSVLAGTRESLKGSLEHMKEHYPLTTQQKGVVERALNILEHNFTENGLHEIYRLTCSFKQEHF